MVSMKEARDRLIEKASSDDAFRTLLINDPRKAVEEEFGVTLPDSFSVTVHEQSPTEAHLVLPPAVKLEERDLKLVSGGLPWCSSGGCW